MKCESAFVGFVNDPSIRYYTVLEFDKWDVDYIREGSFPFEVRFGKCDVSVTNSAYALTGKDLLVVFVVPVFIPFSYLHYMIVVWGVAGVVTMIGLCGVLVPLFVPW